MGVFFYAVSLWYILIAFDENLNVNTHLKTERFADREYKEH